MINFFFVVLWNSNKLCSRQFQFEAMLDNLSNIQHFHSKYAIELYYLRGNRVINIVFFKKVVLVELVTYSRMIMYLQSFNKDAVLNSFHVFCPKRSYWEN